jgi:hypothetical protein
MPLESSLTLDAVSIKMPLSFNCDVRVNVGNDLAGAAVDAAADAWAVEAANRPPQMAIGRDHLAIDVLDRQSPFRADAMGIRVVDQIIG